MATGGKTYIPAEKGEIQYLTVGFEAYTNSPGTEQIFIVMPNQTIRIVEAWGHFHKEDAAQDGDLTIEKDDGTTETSLFTLACAAAEVAPNTPNKFVHAGDAIVSPGEWVQLVLGITGNTSNGVYGTVQLAYYALFTV